MENSPKLKSAARLKVEAYYSEIKRKKIVTTIMAFFVATITVLFAMMVSGDRFNSYLSFLGLSGISNPAGGVYADCALPQNESSPYCQDKKNAAEKSWNRLKSGGKTVFSLFD